MSRATIAAAYQAKPVQSRRPRYQTTPRIGCSLSMVATLNAQQGHRLKVGASGPQAGEALEAVRQLAARDFDDQPAAPVSAGKGGSGLDVASVQLDLAVLAGFCVLVIGAGALTLRREVA